MGKMKALVKKFAEPGIWMDTLDVPLPGVNDVLIKVKHTSICGTDIHIYQWNDWAKKTIKVPMVIGHEYVGQVVEVGANVHSVKVGDIVSGEGHITCGVCRNCFAGRRHLCNDTIGVGVNRQGAFAEYVCIPATNIWKTDPSIPEELYSCFDPFGNAVHTVLKYDLTGEDVLITGAGPIGIMAAAVAQKVGAKNVVLTDLNPYRIELAGKMGIKHVYDCREHSLTDIQKQLNMTEGFDRGLEMSGNKSALNEMIDNMSNGGKIALLGLQTPGTGIDWDKVIFNSLTIQGIYGREMFETWYKMSALIKSGLDITPIITHRFAVDDFLQGFEIMSSGKSGKIILNWED